MDENPYTAPRTMRRRIARVAITAVWLACAATCAYGQVTNPGSRDKDRMSSEDVAGLQGTWIVVNEKFEGTQVQPDREVKVVFKGDTAIFFEGTEAELRFKYVIDPTLSPKHMDLFSAPRKNDRPTKCIYYLMRHDLQIAFTARVLPGAKEAERLRDEVAKKRRPEGFEAKPGESVYSIVLQRERRCGYGLAPPN